MSNEVNLDTLLPLDMRDYIGFVHELLQRDLVAPPIYAGLLQELGEQRSKLRKEMKQLDPSSAEYMARNTQQGSNKLLMVSAYGVSGYESTRFFNEQFFNSVSGMGQYLINTTFALARDMGYEIVYSDTDSVFMYPKAPVDAFRLCLDFPGIADNLTNAIRNYCSIKWGVDLDKYCMVLDAEKVYIKCLFTSSKKKYRGERIWKDGEFGQETELVGFEAKRGDASEVVKQCQLKVQEILIASGDETEIATYVNQLIQDMYAGQLDKDLVLAKAINKARLEDYPTEPPHVKAAKMLQERAGFRSGDTVRFVISGIGKDHKPIVAPIDPAHPDVIPAIQKAGYDYYSQKLLDMVERLLGRPLKGITPGVDRNQTTLLSFGSVAYDGVSSEGIRESSEVPDDTGAVPEGYSETPIESDVQGAIPGLYDPEQE